MAAKKKPEDEMANDLLELELEEPNMTDAEALLAEANAKIAAMQKELEKAKAAAKKPVQQEQPDEKDPDNPMRLVPVFLFKDNERYKDDLFVSLESGKKAMRYQIQRGQRVMVPFCIAEQIREMEKQDRSTAMLIEGLSNQFTERKKEFNID